MTEIEKIKSKPLMELTAKDLRKIANEHNENVEKQVKHVMQTMLGLAEEGVYEKLFRDDNHMSTLSNGTKEKLSSMGFFVYRTEDPNFVKVSW